MAIKLHHIRQLAVKTETTEGTEITSHAATDLVRIADLSIDQRPNAFERPLHTGSFGYVPRHYSTGTCELSFTVEVAGNSDNTSSWTKAPKWGTLLKACDMGQALIYELDVSGGTITGGPLQHLETITETTSGETATVVKDWATGSTTIWVAAPSAAFTGGLTVTGSDSGATFTGGSVNLADTADKKGYVWYPLTAPTTNQSATIRIYNDGDLITVYGARGTVEVDCQTHDIVKLRFTMQGIYDQAEAAALLDDATSGAFEDLTPPAFVNVSTTLDDGTTSTSVNFTELQLSLGNNVAMRANANATSGWQAAVIAGRTPSGRINPDDPTVSTHDFRDALEAGTRFQLDAAWGSATYNTFQVWCPAIEFDSLGDGNRDERQHFDGNFRCTRGMEYGADTDSPGNDNELLIFNV